MDGSQPYGAFANISSNLPAGYSWDTSQLYSTGEVTLIREPSSLALLGADQVGPGPRAKPQSPPMTLRKTHSFAPLAFAREIILCRLFPFLRFSVPHFSVFSPFALIRLNFPVGAVPK